MAKTGRLFCVFLKKKRFGRFIQNCNMKKVFSHQQKHNTKRKNIEKKRGNAHAQTKQKIKETKAMNECYCNECCEICVGSQGFLGAQGMACCGSQGPIGVQGAIAIGAQGTQGSQASLVVGFQGFGGVQGATDNVAPNQGPEGDRGYQGSFDSQGAQGLVGDVGAQGLIGGIENEGPRGFQANSLLNGFQGFQGNRGFGPQGPTGAQGVNISSAFSDAQSGAVTASPGSHVVFPSSIVVTQPAFIRATAHLRFLTTDPVAFGLYDISTMVPVDGLLCILTTNINQAYVPLIIARNVPAGTYAIGFTLTTSTPATIEPSNYSELIINH